MPFEDFLQLIRSGEPVTPGVTNRAPAQIDRNVRYLWDVVQAAGVGSTVYARKVTVEAEAAKGMPVYYNATTERFERALAVVSADPTTGVVETTASSHVFGLVSYKHGATLADVLLFGYAELDLSAAVAGTVASGLYYLSGGTAGRLVRQRPPVSVPVCRVTGTRVFVNPQLVDFLDRHTHYRFPLVCLPAGDHTPPAGGGRHVIDSPDSDLPGWLPADHASFAGKAPAGAKFGYNFAAHSALANAWPPLPVSQSYLEWSKGLDGDVGYTGVPGDLCVLNKDGIWWMSDCYGDVPWPAFWDTTPGTGTSLTEVLGECPRDLYMGLLLWFTKVNFATENTVVTTLRSLDDRLVVRCADGAAGSAGDLTIDLDLSLLVAEEPVRGSMVLKELEDDTFTKGRVVEGVYALTDNVTLASDLDPVKLDPDDEDSADVYQGLVGISVAPQSTLELPVLVTRLEGASEETYQDVMYLELPAGEATGFRSNLYVPTGTGLTAPELRLRFLVLGRSAGALPTLAVTARRVPKPAAVLTGTALPLTAAEFDVTITTTATVTANQYVEAVSDPFEVAAGDTVYFWVRRADDDAYAGAVGVISQVGVLSNGD